MSSFLNLLALVPLALAVTPTMMVPNQVMIFKENDFAMNAGRTGMPITSDGNCMNFDNMSEYAKSSSDYSCNNELFTFTRPHANLLRRAVGDGVGRHVRSMKCAMVHSPADRRGHIFSSNHASTKSPSSCPNDSCSGEQNCQSTHPDYGMYCSSSSKTCQQTSVVGALCREDGQCVNSHCQSGKCMAAAENLRCAQGSECPSSLRCRPTRVLNLLGGSNVEMICMKDEDVRGTQCSAEKPCPAHMSCSLQHETNVYFFVKDVKLGGNGIQIESPGGTGY
ncbi:hypothetical protein N7517_002583 [Penicillium concentricum]|uniref:Dickkopf N-terminal cysteine-rich domain-containing protein n=1 Tax=Penicillium concentricum TaxID=293559 RepID=A0A9W9VJY3_9EURO|nr:uncharacterized protein N7517_002583 [Penicillium concentricum]KAJ5384672.1 hypothetical protein N7517_002583 [Penicillium concentricum]